MLASCGVQMSLCVLSSYWWTGPGGSSKGRRPVKPCLCAGLRVDMWELVVAACSGRRVLAPAPPEKVTLPPISVYPHLTVTVEIP